MDMQESEEDVEKVECEREGLHVALSPAPSLLSVKSDQSMDRPIVFNKEAQSHIGEKMRSDATPSPAPSHLSMTSDQSMDRPIAFNNGKQNYIRERVRSDETPSPALSHLSMASHQSMDRPIAFNNGKQSYMGENLSLDEAPSPAPSYLSVKSDQSMDRPIAFRNGSPDTGLRPNEAPSPSTSYFSLKSNQSMDRPIAFKDNTHPYSAKRLRLEETPSPAPSFQSMKSHQSMDRPIAFNSGTSSYAGYILRPDEPPSPATSYLSLRSDQSMDRPIAFKDRTQTYGAKKVMPVAPSPAPSLMSVKSDQSMDRPIAFNSRAQNYMTDNTLSATLLTEDHYRCSVCTEVFKDPVSIPCGHSYCKHCIEIYWSKPTQPQGYACPQCRKRFRDRPVLNVNLALTKVIEELLKAGFSPAIPAQCYAGSEDVACDICTEMKLKAVKSCLTCTASYCETHIRQHYTVPALQRHNLVEVTKSTQDSEDIKPFKELQDGVIEEQQKEIRNLRSNISEQNMIAMNEKVEYSVPLNWFCNLFICNDLPMDVTEVPALGRPLDLGMLYNCWNESFISGSNLWDNLALTRGRISWPQLKTHLKVLEDDSLQERCTAFEMSPVLRLRALCGLMELSGAAAFLNHPIQSLHQDRATLHYKTTTKLDMVSQKLLQQEAFPSVINSTTATHVIIAVFYGTQAFFVFDNERISTEKNSEMESVIKKITTTNARDVFSSLTETEKANTILYDCSLYIDVGVWKSPVSFNKAVEICDSLPTLVGSKCEKAIPLKVWLYPLKKLVRSSASAGLSGVRDNLMHQVENILEHLRKQIMICQDMLSDYDNLTAITWFPALTEKLQKYSEILLDYRREFQRKTSEIIESINLNEDGVKHLQELITSSDQSLFNPENTKNWLEKKKTELEVLNGCRAANIPIVKSQKELQQVISHPLVSSVFCFTISLMETEDSFLTALKKYIEIMKKRTTDCLKPGDSLQTLKPVCVSEKVFSDLIAFIAAKETNEDAEYTKFIVAYVPNEDCSEFSVQFYHAGRIVSRNVELQKNPDFAHISQIKHNSVSLKINRQNGNIERYVIHYRALDDGTNNTWKQMIFDGKSVTETCVISGLKSRKQYQLRYLGVEQDCMSNFSHIINFKTEFSPILGRPLVTKMSRNTIKLAWLKAEADEHCPVLCYMVEYKEAGLDGWSSVQTQGPECECTLTVPHSTCYRVRISAVYGERDVSKPSGETSVPVDVWSIDLSKRKSSILLEVLKLQTERKPVELIDWTDEECEVRGFLQCLPYVSELRLVEPQNKTAESWEKRKWSFVLDLCLQAALHQKEKMEETVNKFLLPVNYEKSAFLLDLYSHVKDYESQTGRSVLPALQPVYQSAAPAVWSINLSKRKSSILLEVLKLQTEKKPVELIDFTDEEREMRGFLQCLPYISQLRIHEFDLDGMEKSARFLLNLTVAAVKCVATTGENYIELLTSVCNYRSFLHLDDANYAKFQTEHGSFLLDLCSRVKDYESQTGRSVFPELQSFYQSAPAVWRINLSERKSSILLEVLKLQTEKKPVELIDCTDEESEMKGFLQCLPYISQLRNHKFGFKGGMKKRVQFLLNLTVEASKCVTTTGENYIELLTSVCNYRSFLCLNDDDDCPEFQTDYCDFLLDLYSHVKDYESQTGRSVLLAVQPIYQSAAPAVWSINLSEGKSSILLEVLKLQTKKKPVELIDWTNEERNMRGFLQCLPYISQLRFAEPQNKTAESWEKRKRSFILDLCLQAALHEKDKLEETVNKLLSSVKYERSDFLLDLYSHVKDYEIQTGRSVLLVLQPVYQSVPAVWKINLSERKSSILLEVLKLQTEKKPVELIDCTDEEREVRRFLQCLPYISQLSFQSLIGDKKRMCIKFLVNLIVLASDFTTKENYKEIFTSVCSYSSFPLTKNNINHYAEQSDFLLDLYSHVKDYESQTGRSVFSALQSVYQSAPAVWSINLSKRKSSILLEVLKLQTEKKPVELRDWTDEEREVKGFLQCLPYISKLGLEKKKF